MIYCLFVFVSVCVCAHVFGVECCNLQCAKEAKETLIENVMGSLRMSESLQSLCLLYTASYIQTRRRTQTRHT